MNFTKTTSEFNLNYYVGSPYDVLFSNYPDFPEMHTHIGKLVDNVDPMTGDTAYVTHKHRVFKYAKLRETVWYSVTNITALTSGFIIEVILKDGAKYMLDSTDLLYTNDKTALFRFVNQQHGYKYPWEIPKETTIPSLLEE